MKSFRVNEKFLLAEDVGWKEAGKQLKMQIKTSDSIMLFDKGESTRSCLC